MALEVRHEVLNRGSVVVNAKTRRVIHANRAFCKHVGRSLKELRSKPFTEFLHPNYRGDTEKKAEAMETRDEVATSYKNAWIRPNGTEAGLMWDAVIFDGYYTCDVTLL